MSDAAVSMSLHRLAICMNRYYGKKVLIFLDKYDTPLHEAYAYGYWEKLVSFIRSLFNCTFKTNPYMERGQMTGIIRVSKESIFSDISNLEVVTTTSEKYREKGFDRIKSTLNSFLMFTWKKKNMTWSSRLRNWHKITCNYDSG